MEHDGNAVSFGGAVNHLQLFHAVQVVVGEKQLVWRVNLYHANLQAQDLFNVRQDVWRPTWVQPPARDQTRSIFAGVIADKLIHACSKPDYFRSHIVDEHSAINAGGVEVFEE